jgi:pyruvate dehydrogenase E2 component (dihydrolipoamide acetyltransferase)
MAEIVRMPKMSDTMTEGVVVKWHKKVGDAVKSGELVAEIETDKATMEFESYSTGTLLYIGVEEGKAAIVDGILAIMGKAGEDYKPLLEEELKKDAAKVEQKAAPVEAAPAPTPTPVSAPVSAPIQPAVSIATAVSTPSIGLNGDDRLKVSPLAKRLAAEKGIDVSMLKGSGDHGRIIKRDIEWFKPGTFVQTAAFAPNAITKESFEEVPVSQMRKTIAKRLSESMFTAPHFYLTMEKV